MTGPAWVLIALVLALLVVIVMATSHHYAKREAAYRDIAHALGLRVGKEGRFTPVHLLGNIEGMEVRLEEIARGRNSYDQYTITYPRPLPGGLRIVAQSIGRDLLAWFRRDEALATGHERFDALAIVSGKDELAIRDFLDERRRDAIAASLNEFPALEIHHDRLVCTERAGQVDRASIESRIGRFVELSKVLAANS